MRWIIPLIAVFGAVPCSISASPVLSNFAQAASSVKAAGFPKSLSNASYAATQFFSTVLNSSFTAVTQCVRGDLGISSTEIVRGSASTDGCSYGVWILFWFFFGLSLMLVLLTCCAGFGVGRTCCNCCGKPCAPACGGDLPTMTYTNIWAVLSLLVYLALLFLILLLTILGFLSIRSANQSATQLADLVPAVFDHVSLIRENTQSQILSLMPTVSAHLYAANKKLSGLTMLNSTAARLLDALSALDSSIFALQVLNMCC
jgi:hypothetical protein